MPNLANIEIDAARAQVSSVRELRRIADALEELVKIAKIDGLLSAKTGHNMATKGKDNEQDLQHRDSV